MPGGIEKVVTNYHVQGGMDIFFNPIYTICRPIYIYVSIHPKSISIHLSILRIHIISVITLCLRSLAIIVHLQLMVIAMLFEPFLSQLGKSCLPSVCWGLMLQCEQPNSQKLPTESSTGSTSKISQAWVAWVVYEYVHLTIYYANTLHISTQIITKKNTSLYLLIWPTSLKVKGTSWSSHGQITNHLYVGWI